MITVTCWHRGDVVPAEGRYLGAEMYNGTWDFDIVEVIGGMWFDNPESVIREVHWWTEFQIDPATQPPEPFKET